MKNNFALLIILLLAGIIMACGGNKEDAGSTSSTSSASKKEASASGNSSSDSKQAATNRKGKLIYKQYCVICHGADGKLAISNATDLSTSVATLEDRIDQITNGKGLMTPYKDILSAEQISAVSEYVEELRQ